MGMLMRGRDLSAKARLGAMGGMLLTTSALVPSALALTAAMTVTAAAQDKAATRSFDIPAQPLQDAIVLFSRQSGIQVTASGGLTAGRQSAAVRGDQAPAQALGRLLAGTGLSWRMADDNTAVLEAAPQAQDGSVQLGTLRVEGTSGNGGNTNGTGGTGDNGRTAA
ncbi:hypothetical protein GRI97_10920 [Altererythrobacter xixiisoli]|uniref:Secretin/TonB short N-terminal domain-containing protein n=1 Tax=Croceibacterium xixiisoli TaxID=1476466 RepID=A0A6I4TW71_9SPHN|nr:STN domain-containing protein [Croceibacterium xixiisoli]MXO99500.1 hypothetical protein [Croceibacterium xixiisoli]